ncbi:hypothetical protein ACS0TY_002050 [Phlomoides rotata]
MEDVDDGTSLSTENEQNNEASHMENEIYDLTTMVEDLDAMVEAEINEECTENNNEEIRHGLCLWHLHQNAITRFGKLKSDNAFKTRIRSSQRSESTNHAIGFNASLTTNLTEFYGIYKNTIKCWRRTEQQDEFNCSRALPDTSFEMAGIMRHTSENRWTKIAKSEVWDKFGSVLSITSQAGKSIPWRHNITRKFYNLVLRSEDNEDAIKNIEESLKRDSLTIDSLCCTESVRTLSSGKSSSKILDPTRSRTK